MSSTDKRCRLNKTRQQRTDELVQEELLDPSTNILYLFDQFNVQYFYGLLGGVEVKWTKQLKRAAGVCEYRTARNGICTIRLSESLLKFRPRRDIIHTLLHEMIHAFLNVTHNRDPPEVNYSHGENFVREMRRVNSEAGTNVTIFHNFSAEVALYAVYVWRCNGPCRYQAPHFGVLKRHFNRDPCPVDRWFAEHLRICGGEFIKEVETEGCDQRIFKEGVTAKPAKEENGNTDVKGNSHDFPEIDFGDPALQSALWDSFNNKSESEKNEDTSKRSVISTRNASCPICAVEIPLFEMNNHIDNCLISDD